MVNISELLKDAPKGMKLYSPLFGEVTLVCVNCDNNILVETEMHDNHYFAYNGVFRMSGCYPHSECLLFPAKGQSWEGWKLPIAPKFKVGDWIVRSNGSSDVPIQVYGLKRGRYLVTNMLGSKCELMINRQDEWHLWTILDVIDGDVLALNGKPFIYSHNKYGKNYCYIDDCGQFRVNFNLVLEGNCVWPATKQERDLLFSKMREVGYEWDEKKKELRKIIEPNFKVGDWVVTDYGKVSQVVSVDKDGDGYTLDDGVYFSGSWCDMYHRWTIQDAKDGDVLAADECYVIFKEIDGLNIKCYCTYHYMGFNPSFYIDTLQNKTAFHPATKEQGELLFAKIKEAGYQWDVCKKELKKITKHYNIANFHAGMPVLVRDAIDKEWRYVLYSHNTERYGPMRFNAGATIWNQCIPFNEYTKHLLGTTDMPSEEYINW